SLKNMKAPVRFLARFATSIVGTFSSPLFSTLYRRCPCSVCFAGRNLDRFRTHCFVLSFDWNALKGVNSPRWPRYFPAPCPAPKCLVQRTWPRGSFPSRAHRLVRRPTFSPAWSLHLTSHQRPCAWVACPRSVG